MAEYEIPTEEEYERLKMAKEKNLSDLVDKWYDMDPEVEDLLWDSSELVEGMVVLIDNPMLRIDVRYPLSAEMLYQARTWNRWFMISHIVDLNSTHINFMANYEDGSKRKFVAVAKSRSWLCKLGGLNAEAVVSDGSGHEVDMDFGPKIGVAKVAENRFGLNLVVTDELLNYGREETPGSFYGFRDQPITDTAAQERIIQSREGKPSLKPASNFYDETAERWREEKGVHFPAGPFAESPDDDSEKE